MSLFGKTCEVRIYGPQSQYNCGHDYHNVCEKCRIGCFNPAAYRNPFFGTNFGDPEHDWWRGCNYSFAEYMCTFHYDQMVREAKELEDMYREDGVEEDSEYTKILETL